MEPLCNVLVGSWPKAQVMARLAWPVHVLLRICLLSSPKLHFQELFPLYLLAALLSQLLQLTSASALENYFHDHLY